MLLLKIPDDLPIGHGEIKLVLTVNLPPCWSAQLVLSRKLGEKNHQRAYPAVNLVSDSDGQHSEILSTLWELSAV